MSTRRNMRHVALRWFLWDVVIQGSAMLIAWHFVATEEMKRHNEVFFVVALVGIWIGSTVCRNLYEVGLLKLVPRTPPKDAR